MALASLAGSQATDPEILLQRVDELSALYRLTDELYRSTSREDIYNAGLEAILAALRCSRASILLFDDDGVMRFVAARGLSAPYRQAVEGHTPWTPGQKDPNPICIHNIETASEPETLKAVVRAEGIGSLAFIPLVADGGVIGKFMAYYDTPHAFTEAEINLSVTIARQLGFSLERVRAEEARGRAEAARRQSEARLAAELAATQRLQEISALLIQEGESDALYSGLTKAAVSLMGSDAASMQMYDRRRSSLKLLAWTGFHPDSARFWTWVEAESGSSCAAALKSGARVIVPDVEQCGFVLGTADLEAYRKSNIRAVMSTPLISRSGVLVGVISTHWQRPLEPDEHQLRFLDVLARQAADVIERAHTHAELQQNEAHLRLATEGAKVGTWQLDLATGQLVWSRIHKELWGYDIEREPLVLADWTAPIHSDDLHRISAAVEACRIGPQAILDLEYRVVPKGAGRIRWIRSIGRTDLDGAGRRVSLQGVSLDITDRKLVEEQRSLLLNELNHRVKNTLSTVQFLAAQTLRSTESCAQARQVLEDRILALSRAHDVLTSENWGGASLRETVFQALQPFLTTGNRVLTNGPEVKLSPRQTVGLSLALHELATNAAKYGALSNETGEVRVAWCCEIFDGHRRLLLTWAESGGPVVAPPSRKGFGSRLIERSLSSELMGAAELDYRPEGVVCRISMLVDE